MYIAAKRASILKFRLVFNKYAVEDTFLFSMQFWPALAWPALPWPALLHWVPHGHQRAILCKESVFGLMTN